MTKKDYIIFAKMLNEVKKKEAGKNKKLTLSQYLIYDSITYKMGTIFIEDNPNFNREKFENVVYD